MSDVLDPLPPEQETLSFAVPENQPKRQSKYFYDNGKYRARCVAIEMGETKPKEGAEKGDPKVVLSFVVLEGPGTGVDMKLHLPITANMFWKVEQTADALGVPFAKGSKSVDFPRSKCIGADVMLELVQGTFNGRDRMEIKRVFKADAANVAPF